MGEIGPEASEVVDNVCFRDACDGDVPDKRPSPSGTLGRERNIREKGTGGVGEGGREGEGGRGRGGERERDWEIWRWEGIPVLLVRDLEVRLPASQFIKLV